MLSWFNKDSDKSEDGASAFKQSSAIHLVEQEPPRKYPRYSLAGPLSTPHDALLSDSPETLPEAQNQTASPLYDVPSPSAAAIAPGLELLVDPFDGSVRGTMGLPDPNLTTDSIPVGEEVTHNEELWSHLSRVLELQSDIAKLHMGMEGIIGDYGKSKTKGKAASNTRRTRDTMEARSKLDRNTSRVDDMENVGEGEGVEVGSEDDEEERKNREREEEFARLADQFEGRKEGINEIMLKLDDLSQALTEFHTLQAPQLNFPSSRQNSMPIHSAQTSPTTSMDKETRSTFTPRPPITPIISTAFAQKPDRILSPTLMMDSPISTADSALFPKH
ncbi:hypothetical protein PQX77_004462 [Marasmius sp. AFHP31]|nr:hypothetical protein PQX77_004462 [Marasmius sp. AFHP31]